jgi:uncharacterized repeat protein (TIGR01451 family)
MRLRSTITNASKGTKHLLGTLLSAAAIMWSASTSSNAEIVNTVTANGFINGNPVQVIAEESVDVVDQIATISLQKQGIFNDENGDTNAQLGETVSYSFTIKNTGNVTLTNVMVTDALALPSGLVIAPAGDVAPLGDSSDTAAPGWASLAPGDTLVASATYTLTQPDLDAGSVANTADVAAATIPGLQVTAQDSITTELSTASSMTLAKTGTINLVNGVADVGDIITYNFKVTNTGPTTLKNVSVNDPLLLASLPVGTDALTDLIQVAALPSDPITTASVDSDYSGGARREPAEWLPVVPEVQTALSVERRLTRLDSSDALFKAGDRIGVYFKLTNAGAAPLVNLNVTQPGTEAFGSALDILAPNTTDSASILFTHTLTEEDIATGQVELKSTVTAMSRNTRVAQILDAPLSLLDVDMPTDIATASISPTIIPSLAPGGVANFAATYAITQADIDAGTVHNDAVASATNVQNVVLTSPASADVAVPQAPAIAVAKTAALDLGADSTASVGDLITYTFTVSNIGNTTLNNVVVADPLPGVVITAAPINNFAPDATQDITGTYALTQADIDAGKVENQAIATGEAAGTGGDVSGASDDPASPILGDKTIITIPAAPKISLVKEVAGVNDINTNSLTDAGDTILYKFKVKNTGNVALTNVFVKDRNPLVVSNLLPPTGITIAAGAEDTTTFTALYTLVQADVDRGFFDNTADVFGTAPNNSAVQDESDPAVYTNNAPTRHTITRVPGLAVLKPQPTHTDVNGNSIVDTGDKMNYLVEVINTGNVTLTNVKVKDPAAGNFAATLTTLLPGAANSIFVPIVYTITPADVAAGQITNSAFAEAFYNGELIGDESDSVDIRQDNPTITAIVPKPAIALVKPQPDINDVNGNGVTDEGDQLTYTFVVYNMGNTALDNFVFTDTMGSGFVGTVVSTRTTPLPAGTSDSTNFKFTYTLDTADITRGNVSNTAKVVAVSPQSVAVNDTSDDNSVLQNDPTFTTLANLIAPEIALIKQPVLVDVNGDGNIGAGDKINYVFTVKNTGNVVLNNITVTDAKLAGEGVVLSPNGGTIASLAKGQSASFSASHLLTQADIDSGAYENQASVSANYGPRNVTDLSDNDKLTENDPTVTTLERNPSIAVVKPQPTLTDSNGNGVADAGDTLNYSFQIHNTGNVTLYNVVLTDNNADHVTADPPGPIDALLPGESNTTKYTATHLITDLDAKNGRVKNQAEVKAAEINGGILSVADFSDVASTNGRDPTVTPVTIVRPALMKTASKSSIRRGENVVFTITAGNLGNGPYDIADLMPAGLTYVEGTAKVNGVATEPTISGTTLAFNSITPIAATHRIIITLTARAAATIGNGQTKLVNRARIYISSTGDLVGEALARVTIKEEAIFDCGEIIGRVFDDRNNNGYMDDGEVGLPGVRVVTVNGLLVTTDKHGRFHVTCADIPNSMIGSNFIMKLDPRTLPAGYQLTTENPRDVRLTRGKITKLNFGASKSRDIGLDLTRDAFTGGSIDLKGAYVEGIDRLVSLLQQGRGALTITYRCGEYAPIADERLSAVEELVRTKWEEEGGNKPLKITTRVECGK